ncbi:sigma-70 family RNA polymerase sigma factor [Dyella sp. A6]|uniref:sigma-70 family RNA polymerase sigma factor n=1 Tax=Dyella aluminiiresistens TaxID=3069105 RepID=UPI002E75A33A|nr:sigma-70 family RNA polymerase sigma factor [Dyella sp. A6]
MQPGRAIEQDVKDVQDELLLKTASGDQSAFAELYRISSPRLYGLCVRMLRERGTAEEVLQEAWITVWHRASTFDRAKASANTWLGTLFRNKAIDRLRQRKEEVLDDPDLMNDLEDDVPSPAEGAEQSQDYLRLSECLEQLRPQQRRAVREAFFSGVTYNELAARCQVPLGTMKSWIRRSLLQLRTCLDP